MEENTVEYLQSINFDRLTLQQKIDLKGKGRPIPSLMISKAASSRGKSYVRQFNADLYSKNVWLCGCNKKMHYFAFLVCYLEGIQHGQKLVLRIWSTLHEKLISTRLQNPMSITC